MRLKRWSELGLFLESVKIVEGLAANSFFLDIVIKMSINRQSFTVSLIYYISIVHRNPAEDY